MATRTIYIATGNPGKLRDFAAAAQSVPVLAPDLLPEFAVLPMPCLDRIPPPPENETTFAGNARAKATYYSRLAPGLDILADDSGLEVDALHGAPGVRSARYAADQGLSGNGEQIETDAANNSLLLRNLASVAEAHRTARYRCVLALANSGECLLTAEGTVEGRILAAPRGGGGFGYDPLFYLPELGKTMAEIDLPTKDSLSHRGRALRALLAQLQELLSS